MQQLKSIKEPKISIIVTYYNMGKYIEDCIESIMAQTYKNFEVIIVNDCSDSENSNKLIKYQNENIKIISLKKNQGQLCALYEGLKYSNGEFVCMVDADDILLPNYLSVLIYAHINNNYALISSSKGEINEDGELLSLNNQSNKIDYSQVENLFKTKEYCNIEKVKAPFGLWSWNPSTSAMWRKDALKILKYFPNKSYWRCGADKVIFSLLHLIGGSANIDAVLFLYRIHGSNNFNSSTILGDKKYINEKTVNKLIKWNIKLRFDTFFMFLKNRKKIIQEYNKINYLKMLLRVIFCINLKVCAKIIKTFAHKFI